MDGKCCGRCAHGRPAESNEIICGLAYPVCKKMLNAVGLIPASVSVPYWTNMMADGGADCFCFTPKEATDGNKD